MSIEVRDVRGDGNCYYRSLYNVMKYYRRLGIFGAQHPTIDIKTEDIFIQSIRNRLSEAILSGTDGVIGDIYKGYVDIYEVDKATYRMKLESAPFWFQIKYKKMPDTEAKFRTSFAKAIQKMDTWAGEIDIILVNQLIVSKLPFRFVILNDRIPKGFKLKKDRYYIINKGEVHYNYVVKLCPPKKIINPLTYRCINAEGRLAHKLSL